MTESDRRPNGAATSSPPLRVVHGIRTARHRASFGPVADLISRVAETDVTVLLRGERGTGKELVARAIHSASAPARASVRQGRLCASLPRCSRRSCSAASAAPWPAPGSKARTARVRPPRNAVPGPRQRAAAWPSSCDSSASSRTVASRVSARAMPSASTCGSLPSSERDLERAVAEGRFREGPVLPAERGLPDAAATSTAAQRAAGAGRILRARSTRCTTTSRKCALSQETLRLFAEYAWPANLQELEAAVKRIVMLENEAMVCQELIRAMRHPESTRRRGTSRSAVPGELSSRDRHRRLAGAG